MSEEEEETFTEEEANAIIEVAKQSLGGVDQAWGPNSMAFYGPGSRCILLAGEINQELTNSICSQIHQLNRMDDELPITVYINTPGGSVIDALSIYDLLKSVKCPIITVAHGACFSAGLLILAAGDLRLGMKHSLFFYHQPIVESSEFISRELVDSTRQMYIWSQSNMDRIIREKSSMSHQEYRKHFKDRLHKHFGVKKALKYGLIDDLIDYPKKPELTLEVPEEE